MNDRTGTAIFYVLLLVLPVSALLARRLPIGRTLTMALAWAAIFAVVIGVVMLIRG
jgi:aspartyl protease family protein